MLQEDIWDKYCWDKARDIQFYKPSSEPTWKITYSKNQLNKNVLENAFNRYSRRFFLNQDICEENITYIADHIKSDLYEYPFMSLYMINQSSDELYSGIYILDQKDGYFKKTESVYDKKLLLNSLQGMWWASGNGVSFFIAVDLDFVFKDHNKNNSYMNMLISLGVVAQSIIMAGYSKGLGGWMTPALNEDMAKELLGINSSVHEVLYYVKLGHPSGRD